MEFCELVDFYPGLLRLEFRRVARDCRNFELKRLIKFCPMIWIFEMKLDRNESLVGCGIMEISRMTCERRKIYAKNTNH